jgi:hypothetical protein
MVRLPHSVVFAKLVATTLIWGAVIAKQTSQDLDPVLKKYSGVILHFVMLGIKASNNFFSSEMSVYRKYVHGDDYFTLIFRIIFL